MTNPKDLTWEEHKNAERQVLVKELMGGIAKPRYADFLHVYILAIDHLLESFAKLHNLLDVEIAILIYGKIFVNLKTN